MEYVAWLHNYILLIGNWAQITLVSSDIQKEKKAQRCTVNHIAPWPPPTYSAAPLAADSPSMPGPPLFSYFGSIPVARLLRLSKCASPGLLQGDHLRNGSLLDAYLSGTRILCRVPGASVNDRMELMTPTLRLPAAGGCDILQITGGQVVAPQTPTWCMARGPQELRNLPFSLSFMFFTILTLHRKPPSLTDRML